MILTRRSVFAAFTRGFGNESVPPPTSMTLLQKLAVDEGSAAFGVSAEIIYKVKNRVSKMIEAVEMEYAE